MAATVPNRERTKEPEWTLGDRLAKARRTAGFDQAHMAKVLGVSVAAISAWEHDENQPRKLLEVISIWAAETGVPRLWLLEAGGPEGSRWDSPPDLRVLPGGRKPSGEMVQPTLPFLRVWSDN